MLLTGQSLFTSSNTNDNNEDTKYTNPDVDKSTISDKMFSEMKKISKLPAFCENNKSRDFLLRHVCENWEHWKTFINELHMPIAEQSVINKKSSNYKPSFKAFSCGAVNVYTEEEFVV